MRYSSYYLYRKYEKRDGQDVLPVIPATYSIDGEGTMPKVLHLADDPSCSEIPWQYRWVDMDINTDYWCEPCSGTGISYKVKGVLANDQEYGIECDSATTLTRWVIPLSAVTVSIGDCISKINGDVFYTGGRETNYKYIDYVYIPSTVTEIEDNTFSGITTLSTCVLPRTLTKIGKYAFYNCYELENIDLWDDITEIGEHAFDNCDSLTTIHIPSGLTTISLRCFANCGGLYEVDIPKNIHKLEYECFAHSNITKLKISSGITSYGVGTFSGCINLSTVILENGLQSLGTSMFAGCSNLKQITLPESILYTGEYTFEYCTCLKNINIPSGIRSIGNGAFEGCFALEGVGSGFPIEIPSGITAINDSTFKYCIGLTSVDIPDNIQIIYWSAFKGCKNMRSLNIGSGITDIYGDAFSGCTNLSGITINATRPATLHRQVTNHDAFDYTNNCLIYVPYESVTRYKTNWLGYQYRITSVDCPNINLTVNANSTSGSTKIANDIHHLNDLRIDGVQINMDGWSSGYTFDTTGIHYVNFKNDDDTIKYSAFTNCYSITTCTIGSGITSIGDGAFQYCNSLTYVSIPNGVTSIGDRTFNACNSIRNINIPDSVTSIGSSAFTDCTSLSSITIPDSVTSIGNGVFIRCSGLTSVAIGSGVTSINNSEFYHCTSLSNVTIPDNVTSIGDSAFARCSGLTSLSIGSGITTIEANAFADCRNLNNITVNAVTPPALDGSAFSFDEAIEKIYVPCNSVNSYKSASGWSYYASIIQAIPGSCESDRKWFATYTGGTTSSAECDSTSAISQNEIALTDLVSVEIGNCVTNIGYMAFSGCSSLTSITIPDSVTNIGDGAFRSCSGLTSVTIPDSVTYIGERAFYYCSNLSSVTIGSGITSIDYIAFYECSGLTSITINAATPPSLGSFVFDYTNNCPIYVPAASLSAYQSASGWSTYASRITCIQPITRKWLATYSGGTTSSAACDSATTIYEGEITKTNLVSVEIGNCVTNINNWVFDSCSSLTSVTIPDSVTSFGNNVFYYCTMLPNITIPSGVTYIGRECFYSCSGLQSVTVLATTPPSLGNSVFYNTNDCPIYVPAASVSAYQSANKWSIYASRIQAIP